MEVLRGGKKGVKKIEFGTHMFANIRSSGGSKGAVPHCLHTMSYRQWTLNARKSSQLNHNLLFDW